MATSSKTGYDARELTLQLKALFDAQGANVSPDEVQTLLHRHVSNESLIQLLRGGISDIANKIDDAREGAVQPRTMEVQSSIFSASHLELEEVVRATENATHHIMDAAEGVLSALGTDTSTSAEVIRSHVMGIFEACSFQDITGQRINKVVNALIEIEELANSLLSALSPKVKSGNDTLMEGPQLKPPSQDDVDRLFGGD